MATTTFVTHVGVREDNGTIGRAIIYPKGGSPCVRMSTDKGIKIRGEHPFELTVDPAELANTLTKALAVVILARPTKELRAALAQAVPELKLLR